jgi:hypothetical protein
MNGAPAPCKANHREDIKLGGGLRSTLLVGLESFGALDGCGNRSIHDSKRTSAMGFAFLQGGLAAEALERVGAPDAEG